MYSFRVYTVILLSLCISKYVYCSAKLNVPRVLLPVFQDLSINFTLEIIGEGCYQWSTTRPDLIKIKAVFEGIYLLTCSQNATISVLSKEMTKNTAIVYAQSTNMDLILRADVILDVIASLKIISQSRELNIEEPPQIFEVRAYDKNGNEFTTLGGVEFKWSVQSTTDSKSSVIRLMSFSETPYETPSTIAPFDFIGKHGHIVLLEGINTGTGKVTSQLPYSEYINVLPAVLQVVVSANLIIEPSNIYILPEDTIYFKLYQVHRGNRYEIEPSNRQYHLVSENNYIAEIDNRIAKGKALGTVRVMVRDIYISENKTIELPSALVVVTKPQYMTLSVLPFNSWSLTIGQEAMFTPELFNIDGHKITLIEYSVIQTKVPNNIFELTSEKKNGSVVGIAHKSGSGKVISQLYGHFLYDIGVEGVLNVYPQIVLTPEVLVLPWVAEYTPRLRGHSLAVSGGDSNYEWTSMNTSVVQVSQDGFLKFVSSGSTAVLVCMQKNKNSSASTVVHLLPPYEIHVFHQFSEAFIGDNIILNIILYGRIINENSAVRMLFDTCSFLNFSVKCSEPFINDNVVDKKVMGGGCATVAVKAQNVGTSKVKVSLKSSDKELSVEVLLAAHKPLMVLQPMLKENVILSFASHYDIVFIGGPRPIFGPIKSLTSFSKSLLKTTVKATRPNLYVFRVYCKKMGSTSFEMELSTQPFGYHGITSKVRTEVNCKIPRSMEIVGFLNSNSNLPQRFLAFAFSKMIFSVNVYDDLGQCFQNATSLLMKWAFDNQSVAHFEPSDGLRLIERHHIDYISGYTHFITIRTYQYYADVIGRAWALGYKSENPLAKGYAKEHFSPISREITSFILSVVQEPSVEPQFLCLLNHPNNFEYLKINGGSGYFSLELTSQVVSVVYDSKLRMAKITPLTEGNCEIKLIDQYFPGVNALKIDIQVVSVAIVKISSPLNVQEGQHIRVIAHVFDKIGKPLAIPNLKHGILGFKMVVSNPSVAEFENINNAKIDYSNGSIEINLKGKKQGNTIIRVFWLDISSNTEHIQVFPKIKISPRNVTLAVGSEIEITVTGGPLSLDSFIHFLVGDEAIASVSSDRIIKGIHPGKTRVTVFSMAHDGEVYSKDIVEAQVLSLRGIHIVPPTTILGVGNSMPVWASGIPNVITPLLLGSISPSLQFKWFYSVPNIIQIRDSLYNTNVQVLSENKLSVRVFGLSPGRTLLQLEVTGLDHNKTNFIFNSSVSVEVRNKLALTRPHLGVSPFLMAQNTAYKLKANTLDKVFKIIQSTDIWCSSTVEPLLNAYSDGMVISNTNLGLSVIYAKSFETDLTIKEVVCPVMVEEVHYLMINIATVLETTEIMKTLPQGLYLNVTITYHDQFGYEFSVPPQTKPIVLSNICSSIHNEYVRSNHSIITSLANTGNVILKVQDSVNHRYMEDYIKIPIDSYILPHKNSFTVGEVVCFWTPLISFSGIWTSDNNAMAMKKEGIATAMRVGSSIITYSTSAPEPVVLTSVDVEILPLHSFFIGGVANISITNILKTEYQIPVFLINEKHKKEPSYYQHCNSSVKFYVDLPFDCELHYTSASKLYPIKNMFNVSASFNYAMGSYVCVILPMQGVSPETSKIESNLTLMVLSPNRDIKESLFLNFYPQFFVNIDAIYFSGNTIYSHVEISGSYHVLANIYIDVSDHKFLEFDNPHYENNQISFLVRMIGLHEVEGSCSFENAYLLITSSLTKQNLKIPVFYNGEKSLGILMATIYSMWTVFQNFFSALSIISTALVVALIAICCSLRYIPNLEEIQDTSSRTGNSSSDSPFSRRLAYSGVFSLDNSGQKYYKRPVKPLLASPTFVKNLAPHQ